MRNSIADIRQSLSGLYGGLQSFSTSPSPAPYYKEETLDDATSSSTVTTKDDVIEPPFANWRQLELLARLFYAFKRADHDRTLYPTTHSVAQCFKTDTVTHEIFHLRHETTASTPQAPEPPTNGKRKSAFASAKSSRSEGLMSHIRTLPDTIFRTPDPSNKLFQSFKLLKNITVNTFTYLTTNSQPVLTPASKVKLNKILAQLRKVELERIYGTSLRQSGEIKIDFPTYAAAFAQFVGDGDQSLVGNTKGETETDDQEYRRFLGKTITEALARDGVLGANLTAYESILPCGLTMPLTALAENPSCALAPRNRGELPRPMAPAPPDNSPPLLSEVHISSIPLFPETEEFVAASKELLRCLREERALRERAIADVERLDRPEELFDEPIARKRKRDTLAAHLEDLRGEVGINLLKGGVGSSRRPYISTERPPPPQPSFDLLRSYSKELESKPTVPSVYRVGSQQSIEEPSWIAEELSKSFSRRSNEPLSLTTSQRISS